MKAFDWANRFKKENIGIVLRDYERELHQLMVTRCQFTDGRTAVGAVVGVIREQRQKWTSICRHYPVLKAQDFEKLLAKAFPDAKEVEEKYALQCTAQRA